MKEQSQFLLANILLLVLLAIVPEVTAADFFTPMPIVLRIDDSSMEELFIPDITPGRHGEIVWSAYNYLSRTGIAATRHGTVLITCTNGSIAMQNTGIGRPGSVLPSTPGTIMSDVNRLEIFHSGYSEWYMINDAGIEQGMTIPDRPEGSGALIISFDLEGDLRPAFAGKNLVFSDRYGPLLYYGRITVLDHDGKTLPAELVLSGNQLVWKIDDTNATYPITIDPIIATQVASFSSPDPLNNAGFGVSVSVWNDTMLIAEDGASVGAFPYAGKVHVYQKAAGNWHYTASLESPDPSSLARFGSSVSLFNDTAVIGARLADPSGVTNAGEAYVYQYSGGMWNLSECLSASDKSASAGFGSSVSISGDTIAVGAPSALVNGKNAGGVYIFTNSGGIWTQAASIASPDEANSVKFGTSVSLDDDTFVTGSPLAPTGSATTAPGRAYVYTGSGTTWIRTANLSAWSNPSANAFFGNSVSLDGDTIVVGAQYADPGFTNAGQAYIFKKTGIWTQDESLTAPDRSANAYFGNSVSIHGTIVVIGAYLADPLGVYDGGAAYVFEYSGGAWDLVATLSAADESDGDGFGKAISLHKTTVIAGAPYASTSGTSMAGKAYAFDLISPVPAPTVTAITPSSGVNTSDVEITNLTGTGFSMTGTTEVRLIRTGYSNITTTATVVSSEKITCILPITGAAAGVWDIVVVNPDGQEGSGSNLFTVVEGIPAPSVSSISPSGGFNTGTVLVEITGSNFNTTIPGGTIVRLTKSGEPDITVSGLTPVSSTRIDVEFPITGASAGYWDVIVTNPDGQTGVGVDLFMIASPTPTVTPTMIRTTLPPYSDSSIDSIDTGPSITTSGAATLPEIHVGSEGIFSFTMTCSDGIPLAITRVRIIPSHDLGETTVTVARSSGSLAEVRNLPVAGYENIEIVGLPNTVIYEGSVSFVLCGSWLAEHHLDPSSPVMMREDHGVWEILPTVFLYEREGRYYFTATTSGFSTFAVTVRDPEPETLLNPTAGVTPSPITTESPVMTTRESPEIPSYGAPGIVSYIPTDNQSSALVEDQAGLPGIPMAHIALIALFVVAITIWGIVIRHWWRRRQNPSLFRKYD